MRRHLILSLFLGSIAAGLAADTLTPRWGGTSESILWVGAYAFAPQNSSETYAIGPAGSRYITAGIGGNFLSSVSLPSGALVTGLDFMGCDSSDTGYIQFGLFKQSIAGGSEDLVFIGGPFSTGLSETPGCLRYTVTTAPAIINNASLGHGLLVQQFGDTTGALRFYGIGIRYRLQVSPSPASASFGDVPTDHPLFQFVEALASAGITGGCGGGNYCPDAPITRGQMAVFLSVALGLHFPN